MKAFAQRHRWWLVFGLFVIVAFAAAAANQARETPPDAYVMLDPDPAWPQDSLEDVASYADAVAVVTVQREDALPLGERERTEGEGYLGRTVTLDVEPPVWTRDGAASVTSPLTVKVLGWQLNDKVAYPIRTPLGARLEVGGRYVVALARVTNDDGGKEWATWATFPLDGDTVREAPAGVVSAWRAASGMTMEEYAALLARTKPDPLAVKHGDLDPEARWLAVSGELPR